MHFKHLLGLIVLLTISFPTWARAFQEADPALAAVPAQYLEALQKWTVQKDKKRIVSDLETKNVKAWLANEMKLPKGSNLSLMAGKWNRDSALWLGTTIRGYLTLGNPSTMSDVWKYYTFRFAYNLKSHTVELTDGNQVISREAFRALLDQILQARKHGVVISRGLFKDGRLLLITTPLDKKRRKTQDYRVYVGKPGKFTIFRVTKIEVKSHELDGQLIMTTSGGKLEAGNLELWTWNTIPFSFAEAVVMPLVGVKEIYVPAK